MIEGAWNELVIGIIAGAGTIFSALVGFVLARVKAGTAEAAARKTILESLEDQVRRLERDREEARARISEIERDRAASIIRVRELEKEVGKVRSAAEESGIFKVR